jgi:transposase InsO family protein
MNEAGKLSLEQMQAFLEGSGPVEFEAKNQGDLYEWVTGTLLEHGYIRLPKTGKGVVRRYIAKMRGLSRAQTTRLIGQYIDQGEVRIRRARRHRFSPRYSKADIELLVTVDEAHDTLSGPATQKILYREFHEYADIRYETLSSISVAHIYNLRKRREYRERRMSFQKTKPTPVSIGERRRPEPDGNAGYLRIDTVHQGDRDGVKGVYHINAVDEVTQWQVVGATERISEAWLKPVLEGILEQFPFRIRGFHSDNGSEFINHTVADMLNKLLIEQTKSRPRHSNDNGLVETKNGAVIRKHMGFSHIESAHADQINTFYKDYFNPYLNFHRPCGVPEVITNERGKTKRIYKWYATPLEILRQLPGMAGFLRDDVTMEELERQAGRQTDTGAAIKMQDAKRKLFADFAQKKIA